MKVKLILVATLYASMGVACVGGFMSRFPIEGNVGSPVGMYVGIMSHASEKYLRDTIRSTWMAHSKMRIGFFVARDWDHWYAVELENEANGDMVLMHHSSETDEGIIVKKIEEVLKVGSTWMDNDYIVAVRGDCVVREDSLVSFVNDNRRSRTFQESIVVAEDAPNKDVPNVAIVPRRIAQRMYMNVTSPFVDVIADSPKVSSSVMSELMCTETTIIALNMTSSHLSCIHQSPTLTCCS